MKVVGKRRLRELQARASGVLLAEGARFNEGMERFPDLASTFIPKGLYRFRTPEEADAHRSRCLAQGMARLARKRG
jgi:hypothetical protein